MMTVIYSFGTLINGCDHFLYIGLGSMDEYKYPLEVCDVPDERRSNLRAYRDFRQECLKRLAGNSETSLINQILKLTWHTLVFRTLNEGLRIGSRRRVNGAMWDLITEGYANIAMVGVRKLIDHDHRNNSLLRVIRYLKENASLLTREHFVCFDGLPYDFEKVQKTYYANLSQGDLSTPRWLANEGPESWSTSMIMHEQFDKFVSAYSRERNRLDVVDHDIFDELEQQLKHPAILRVRDKVNREIVHTPNIYHERKPKQIPKVTFNDIDEALKNLSQVGSKIGVILCDGSFSSIVATPQFNVLEGLDVPWASTENMWKLGEYWSSLSNEIEKWSEG